MSVIKRYLSDKNLKRFETDFKSLIKTVNNSNGELDIAIRSNYLNIYYKGNSLAKISFKALDKYKVGIHKKFLKVRLPMTPNSLKRLPSQIAIWP